MVPLKVSVSGDINRRPRWEEHSARWKGLRPEKLGEGQTFSWVGDVGKVEPRRVGLARGNPWRAQKPPFAALAHTTVFSSPRRRSSPLSPYSLPPTMKGRENMKEPWAQSAKRRLMIRLCRAPPVRCRSWPRRRRRRPGPPSLHLPLPQQARPSKKCLLASSTRF